VLGVAAANASHSNIMVAGIAGLVAGAMSMAAGEYVSVRSQADSEEAALNLERSELEAGLGYCCFGASAIATHWTDRS
jgi:vacuolar iron transporter family protein